MYLETSNVSRYTDPQFQSGEAVFFTGKPWYGSAQGFSDAYEKPVIEPIIDKETYQNRFIPDAESIQDGIRKQLDKDLDYYENNVSERPHTNFSRSLRLSFDLRTLKTPEEARLLVSGIKTVALDVKYDGFTISLSLFFQDIYGEAMLDREAMQEFSSLFISLGSKISDLSMTPPKILGDPDSVFSGFMADLNRSGLKKIEIMLNSHEPHAQTLLSGLGNQFERISIDIDDRRAVSPEIVSATIRRIKDKEFTNLTYLQFSYPDGFPFPKSELVSLKESNPSLHIATYGPNWLGDSEAKYEKEKN